MSQNEKNELPELPRLPELGTVKVDEWLWLWLVLVTVLSGFVGACVWGFVSRLSESSNEWKSFLIIAVGGILFCLLLFVFYRIYTAYQMGREKERDFWRKCYFERFNCELEKWKKEELVGKMEFAKMKEEHQNKMEFYLLLMHTLEGKKVTLESLENYKKQLEEEYKELKKLMDQVN